MRTMILPVLLLSLAGFLSTGCSKAPPADKPDTPSVSEVVLLVPGMT